MEKLRKRLLLSSKAHPRRLWPNIFAIRVLAISPSFGRELALWYMALEVIASHSWAKFSVLD
jgi:hypothetical protein